jgi:hypothetical protein
MVSILVLGAGELGLQVLPVPARIAPQHTSITVLLRSTTINTARLAEKLAQLDVLRTC